MFKKRSFKEIVIYDDYMKDVQLFSLEFFMYFVLFLLLREGKDVYIFKGLYFFFIYILLFIMIFEKKCLYFLS